MISKDSKIFLTVVDRGEYLVRKGKYQSAEIDVVNGLTKHEKCNIVKPMNVKQQPVYLHSTRAITLGSAFIENALTKPFAPKNKNAFHRFLKTPMGQLWKNWKNTSDEQKIKLHLEELAESLGGKIQDYEIL